MDSYRVKVIFNKRWRIYMYIGNINSHKDALCTHIQGVSFIIGHRISFVYTYCFKKHFLL